MVGRILTEKVSNTVDVNELYTQYAEKDYAATIDKDGTGNEDLYRRWIKTTNKLEKATDAVLVAEYEYINNYGVEAFCDVKTRYKKEGK